MANKDMERLVISGLDANNYILTPDTTLSKDGVPADAGAVGDALEEVSEDIEGVQEDLSTLNTEGTVPTSEQMLSGNYTEDSVPYHFRKTVSDNADREELEIVGGSVAWNQYVQNGDFSDGSTGWEKTNTATQINSTDSKTLTMDCAAVNSGIRTSTSYIKDHKYLKTADVKSTAIVRFDIDGAFVKTSLGSGNWETLVNVFDYNYNSNTFYLYIRLQSNATVFGEVQVRNVMLIDLTVMFGSTIADYIYALEQATAGAGVALFKSLFPKDYYAYDSGSMQSVSGLSEHRTVGFNAWDEEWEVGSLNPTTGEKADATDRIRSKNFIPITGNQYYFSTQTVANTLWANVLFYDENKNYIDYRGVYSPNSTSNPNYNNPVTPYARAKYMRFVVNSTYGNVYKNDICINISDSAKNGTYEPYDGHSYPLDDSLTLRGIPTLVDGKIKWDGDVYSTDGKVMRRYGIVDLGTLTWTRNTDYANPFYVSSVTAKLNSSQNMCCLKYAYGNLITGTTALNNMVDKTINAGNGSNYIYVRDDAYTDAATFKAAMSGVMLVYELATPTTEQADPYVSPQICHYDGTEEFVSTGIVPVGHNTKYPDNMRAKLDGLPWNFASLIAPTESGFKATRNYTTGALLIVNNVLYKATANIANGGTITVGTNVTATTLAEVIAALS